MNMKELDTVLKSIEYKKERDELYEILESIDSTLEALEDGRQIKIMPKLPRTPISYLDKSNRVVTYEWQNGDTRYTSHYTQTGNQTDSNTPSQDSASPRDNSSYSGGGGDFSGGGSGGSWD